MSKEQLDFTEAADAAIAAALEEIGRSRQQLAAEIDEEVQRLLVRSIARAIAVALHTRPRPPRETRARP